MQVEYVLLARDLIAFNEFHLKRQPVSWKPLLAFLGFYAVMLSGFIMTQGGITSDGIIAAVSMGIICFGIFLQLKTGYRTQLKQVRKGVNRGLYVGSLGWRRLSISPRGITIQTETSEFTVVWAGVWEIAVTPRHALFYTGRDWAFILPDAAFRNRAEFDAYVRTAREYAETSKDGGAVTPSATGNAQNTDVKPSTHHTRPG
jgi:hypothetical protein